MHMVHTAFLALVASASVPVAAAPGPSSAAPGEITLEIVETGNVETPADVITFNIVLTARGKDANAAQAAVTARFDQAKKALVEKGISPDAVTWAPAATPFGFVGNEAMNFADPVQDDGDNQKSLRDALAALPGADDDSKWAHANMRIRLNGPKQMGVVRQVVYAQNLTMAGAPDTELVNDHAARQGAIAAAIGRAREDADIYAANLGMKVVRISKVSNQRQAGGMDYLALAKSFIAPKTRETSVTTSADVVVEFVIAPR